MIKRSELFFSFIQVPIDFAMIILAALTAFAMRNVPEILILKPKLYSFPLESYLKVVLLIAPVFILIYAIEGLYAVRVTRKFWKEALKVFTATSIGLVIIIVAIFLKREWFSSRFIILAGWFIAVFYVVFARLILIRIQKYLLRKKGLGVHRVLLIGYNGKMNLINDLIKKNKDFGYRVINHIETPHLKEIKIIREERGIDEIILCDIGIADSDQEKLVDYCAINNIVYRYVPTTLQSARIKVVFLGGEPLIEVENTPLEGWGRILKRIFDIIVSIFGIIITSPIMIATAIAIKIESKGPIIYKNERVGSDGKKINVFKFRYMKWEYCVSKENTDLDKALNMEKELIEKQSVRKGPLYKIKNDPRKTQVGAIIEKLSIDELPQFFNVLFGSMSMVGPRPHQKREVAKYMDYHRRLLTISPGITGLAQVSGRSDLAFENEYRFDVFYIENWSLWLDIQICLKTIFVLLNRRKN